MMAKWNTDAANIAAERDEWKRRAEVAEAVAKDARAAERGWRGRAETAEAELARIRAADTANQRGQG